MGNGRWMAGSLEKRSGSRAALVGAVLALLVAGSGLLGLGSRRDEQKDTTQGAGSPILAASRSFPQGAHAKPDARAVLGQLPMIFEPNQGQADAKVEFLAQGAGYTLFLDETSATLGMATLGTSGERSQHFVRMKLVGANQNATATGSGSLPGKSNYFIGNDPKKWHSGIPQFAGVHYEGVYPGIDLVFYGQQGHLEYDFKVAPGADAARAELQFEGTSKLELNGGDLILTGADDGGLRLQAPQMYQRDGDRRIPVAGRFVLRADNRVGFEIGPYDRSRELVIDPVLQFSTYFGSGTLTSPSVAVNGNGNIYLVGSNTPPLFTVNGKGTLLAPSTLPNIFVAEISPSQPAAVLYLTFLGGSGVDTSVGLAVDGGGNAYFVGETNSTDFPTGGIPYQKAPEAKTQCGGFPTCNSIFVSELDPTGATLIYSSYLSGNGDDEATGMAVDTNRDVFLTGTTTSNQEPATDEFPATHLPTPYQTAPKSGSTIQFFLTEVSTNSPGLQSIPYSTYFGGTNNAGGTTAVGGGIAVDSTENVYFSGTTNFYNSGSGQFGNSGQTTDFPIVNAYQPCLDTPPPLTLQSANPCTAPTTSPYPTDAFVAKLTPLNAQTGNAQLIFSTYLGGTATDSSTGLAIDPTAANVYLTGTTNSQDFTIPTGVTAFQPCLDTPPVTPPVLTCTAITAPAPTDAYVARFNNLTLSTNGTQVNEELTYFSYLGGTGNDSGAAIAADTANDAYVTGATSSTDFPVTTGAVQSTLGTGAMQNAFFAHLNTVPVNGTNQVGSYSTYFGGNGSDRGTSIAVDTVTLNSYFAGDTTSNALFPTEDALQGALSGARDAFVAELVPANDVSVSAVIPTSQNVSAGNQVTLGFTVTNNGPDLATAVYVNGAVSTTDVTFVSATATSGSCSGVVNNSVVCIIPTLQAGSTSTVNFVVTASQIGAYEATASVVKINNTNTTLSATSPFVAGGFSMAVSPSSQTVAAGQTAPYTVQLTPSGAFSSSVSLTCSGAPAGASCNFSSSSVTFSGGTSGASSALNLTTTPQPAASGKLWGWKGPIYAFWLMIPGMAVFGLGSQSRRRRWLGLLALPMLLALVSLVPSCSSSKTLPPVSGTPSGTYAMTVTATSGTLSQSQSFQLTVTP